MPEASLDVSRLSLSRTPSGASALLGPLSFSLPHAGCWWLAGVSGAGKSLLMESLAGFHADAQGSVRVNGKEVGRYAPERRSITLMPQRWKLFPHWTVARNLRFAARLADAEGRAPDPGAHPDRLNPDLQEPDRSVRLARRLQVADLLRRPARALSGGETQRIALIQTLLAPARILLLDEPLSAVDAALQSVVLDLLEEECASSGRICLLASHKPFATHPMQGTLNIAKGLLVSPTETSAGN